MFSRILRNSVLAGDIGDKYGIFWWSSGCHTVCVHDCHSGCDGRNTENIELSLSEVLPVNLVSVSCSYRRKILHIWWV